jgi:hypothetical protein
MKFELSCYKSAKSKDSYLKVEITIKELEHMYEMIDKECSMSDALYGLAGGTRGYRSLIFNLHAKLEKMIQSQRKIPSEENMKKLPVPTESLAE